MHGAGMSSEECVMHHLIGARYPQKHQYYIHSQLAVAALNAVTHDRSLRPTLVCGP